MDLLSGGRQTITADDSVKLILSFLLNVRVHQHRIDEVLDECQRGLTTGSNYNSITEVNTNQARLVRELKMTDTPLR